MKKSKVHTEAFRQRRALNWIVLGLTYSSMYMGRYNLSLVNPVLSGTYGWDKTQIGGIISSALLGYGIFAMFNGVLSDRVGGRKSILIGASGAALCNLIFGMGAYLPFLGSGILLISFFSAVWMLNSYFQSFGAVSLIKINSAWFLPQERGLFSALFGSMLQIGRTAVFASFPLLLSFLSWQWLFFIPSAVISLMLFLTFLFVQEKPEKCGLENIIYSSLLSQGSPTLKEILTKILTTPATLAIALAEFCTGIIRHGFEQWFPRYLVEVHHLSFDSASFMRSGGAVVVAGILGFFISGILSDSVFGGRRTPVACLAYCIQIVSLGMIWKAPSLSWVTPAFMLHACSITMVHGMLSGAAPVDFGGQKAAATAAGLFDGMQYIGGSLVGIGMGYLLDHFGWQSWAPSMVGFSIIGACLMGVFWNAKSSE